MYSIQQAMQVLQDPQLALHELNRIYFKRAYTIDYNRNGVNFFDEDWDNLIILDACRYDVFQDNNTLEGTLESRISRGSETREFLRSNFSGRELLDTVYVTANPQFYRFRDEIDTTLHTVVHVWKENGWDDRRGTVLPKTTTEYAKRTADRFPNKRLVVHYIQPHYPFINSQTDFDKGQLEDPNAPPNFWKEMRAGNLELPRERLWDAYEENLQTTLPHVRDLIKNLEGRTVVTSDHGNMFGGPGYPIPVPVWGHPTGIYTKELVEVPWLISEGARREIFAEQPLEENEVVSDEVVQNRLEYLGYVS